MTDQHVRPRSLPWVPEQRAPEEPSPAQPAPKHRAELPAAYARPAPVTTTPEPAPKPAHAPRTSRRGTRLAMVLPLSLGGLAVYAAAASGISLLTTHAQHTTHSFTLASTAAGMTRDPSQEAAYADQVSSVEDSFQLQFMGRLSQFVTGVYDNPTAAPGRPAGPVVFVGAAINTHGDPQDFVDAFRTQAEATGATVTVADVGAGALGVCSQSVAAPAVTSCAWSTGDSVGQLVPTVDGWDGAGLGAAMKDFRAALETSTAN